MNLDSNRVATVQRAFDLLRCFSFEEPELSGTQLSCKLGVHKSTVSRMLATLESNGIVSRNQDNGKFRLAIGLIELAGRVTLHADLCQSARPFLRQLSEETQEMVNLAILDSGESLNIEQAVAYDRHVSGIGWIGRRAPLHASSTGKVLLAFLPETEIKKILGSPLPRYTENSITDPQIMMIELNEIRTLGYATGFQELEIGLNAVAAPVYDYSGCVLAAVSVTGPSPRLSEERIAARVAKMVVETARQISNALGFHL